MKLPIRQPVLGASFSPQGKDQSVPSMEICPVPVAPLPMLIGGHAAAARACEADTLPLQAEIDALRGPADRILVKR